VLADFMARLSDDLARDFLRVVELIGAALPIDALYADMGSEPEKVSGNRIADDTLGHAVRAAYEVLHRSGLARATIVEMLGFAEPFRSNWSRSEQVIGTIPDDGDRDA
jgi:hypothetical protein